LSRFSIGEQRGLEEGQKLGEQVGILSAKRETLLQILTIKFGVLPDEFTELVQHMDEIVQLDQWIAQALQAESLEALFNPVSDENKMT